MTNSSSLWGASLLDAAAANNDVATDVDAYLLLDQDAADTQQQMLCDGGVVDTSLPQCGAACGLNSLSGDLPVCGGLLSVPVGPPGTSSCGGPYFAPAADAPAAAAAVPRDNAVGHAATHKGKFGSGGVGGVRRSTSLAQREAHKRYREKKKQSIAAMEAAVETKRAVLLQLQEENEALKSKARVLETAERCSVEIHELMKLLDGLQSLSQQEEAEGGGGSSSATSLAPSYGNNNAVAAAAGGGGGSGGSGSSPAGSSRGSLVHAPGGLAVSAVVPVVTQGTFLHNLMHNSDLNQQQQQQHSAAAGSGAAAGGGVKQEGCQQQQQPPQQQLISLQNEAHWMQLAQQYVDNTQLQQQAYQVVQQQPQQEGGGVTGGVCSWPPSTADGRLNFCAAAADASAADGAAGCTLQQPQQQQGSCLAAAVGTTLKAEQQQQQQPCSSVSGQAAAAAAPSSTAESGSSVLADLGSVDTPEQGLILYKDFLQKASELLALAQQQQQQGDYAAATATDSQLGELTRSTLGRLQPFLVARGQGIVYEWNQRNIDTLEVVDPPASLWPDVLDALQLTEQTQRDALQCFELFGAPLSRLLEERAQLAQRYRVWQKAQGASSSAAAHQGSAGGGGARAAGSGVSARAAPSSGDDIVDIGRARTLESVADSFFSSVQLLKALAANLERYQSLDGVFAHSLTNLLTGAQIAAACVASYPFLPRWHTMMATLKQRKKEEDRQQQIKGGGSGGGAGGASAMATRRSSRVRAATQAAREAYV